MNNKRLRMLNDELGLNDYAEAPNSQSQEQRVGKHHGGKRNGGGIQRKE